MKTKAEPEVRGGRNHIIERPRLTRLLDETSARVIMLVAPAGYGKTTLARQWLANRPHAWYQGSAASSDVAALALGIADAAKQLLPVTGCRLGQWLPTSREPESEIEIIAELLYADLDRWPDNAWFSIDDYHLLASEASQELIQQLLLEFRFLLTSRTRPGWASARDLLYGTVFELGPSALSMTPDEANAVLDHGGAGSASGLVALADGWPAVIGLAAIAPAQALVESAITDALHDFLAEELYSGLRESTKAALCRLALVPTANSALARDLLGADAEAALEEATRSGFFPGRDHDSPDLHPLMRAFLISKLEQGEPAELNAAVTAAVQLLIRHGLWQDAFSLITDFRRLDLLDELISEGAHVLTRKGQLATIREWLRYARDQEFSSAHLDLASADVSFREGRYDRAEVLASSAAAVLPDSDRFASSAHFRAGQCSCFLDEVEHASWHLRQARETAQTETDARNAVWGEFCLACDTEDADLKALLDDFDAIGPPDRDSEVRHACGVLTVSLWEGGLKEALARTSPMRDLVSEATDPLTRSMFWRGLAGVCTLAGEYGEALEAVDRAIAESEQFHLIFVRPHALISRVHALTGLERFGAARVALEEVERSAEALGEPYLMTNSAIGRCRLLLAEGAPEAGLAAIGWNPPSSASVGRQAEYGATRAAALLAAGKIDDALDLTARLRGMTGWLAAHLLIDWVAAICALLLDDPDAQVRLEAAYAESVRTGALDPIVFASSIHPDVQRFVTEQSFNRADQRGASGSRSSRAVDGAEQRLSEEPLTRREQEVLALLAQGLTNREIAQALVISEVTAKVHVRHILKKLGVRTRTQAALKAVDNQPAAASRLLNGTTE